MLKSFIVSILLSTFFVTAGFSQTNSKSPADEHLDRGNVHLDNRNYDQAIAEYSKAIEINPAFVNAYNNRAIVYKRKGEYDLALVDYAKAIKLDPKDFDLYSNRANVYWLQKNYAAADADFSTAIRLKPDKASLLLGRADLRMGQNEFNTAIADYTKALEIDPRLSAAYLNRGVASARIKDWENAYKDYKKAVASYSEEIQRSPKNIDAIFNRGLAYANLEEFVLAIEDFTSVINLDAQGAINAYYERANAYDAVLEPELAKSDRRKYTQSGGTRPTPEPRRSFYPKAAFSIEAARDAFQRGNSSVYGIICTKYNGAVFRAAGARISLFPVTPYLDQWHKLREKKESKNTAVFMSNEAVRWRIDVTANQEGRFFFGDLKPGRYFLQVFHNFTSRHTGRADRGSSTEVINGVLTTTNYYEDYDYTVGHADRIEKFVEVKRDGDEEKVTLMKGGGLLKLGGCL